MDSPVTSVVFRCSRRVARKLKSSVPRRGAGARQGHVIVGLDIESAGLQAVQILVQRADLGDRAIGREGDEVAVGARLAAAIHQHLGCQGRDRILDVDVVVVYRKPQTLEPARAEHGKAGGRGVGDLGNKLGIAAADGGCQSSIDRLKCRGQRADRARSHSAPGYRASVRPAAVARTSGSQTRPYFDVVTVPLVL